MDLLVDIGLFNYINKIIGGDDYELYKDVLPSIDENNKCSCEDCECVKKGLVEKFDREHL